VAVAVPRSPELIAAWIGILAAGCAYVPLDPAHPDERLLFQIRDAGACVLLADGPAAARLAAAPCPVLLLGDVLRGLEARAGEVPVDAGDLAYVIHTSGSTGRPKGVAVTHRGLSNLVEWHLRTFELGGLDRTSFLAGVSFDAAAWEVWPTLAAGASLHLPDEEIRAIPERLRDWLVTEGVTVAFLPTVTAARALSLAWPETGPLRLLLTGGDRLPQGSRPGIRFRVLNQYGPTETTVVATSGEVTEEAGAPAIGRPISNLRIHLLDGGFAAVPVGVPGELWISGPGLARGYLGNAALTADRFRPDPQAELPGGRLYRSGDLARWRADGRIEFLGRRDRQVKIRGVRVEPGEIETILAEHPAVREVFVAPRKDDSGERWLAAYVVATGEVPAARDLRDWARTHLPEALVPAAFAFLPELPLTRHGKVDAAALPAVRRGGGDRAPSLAPPRDAVEQRLAELWQEVLEVRIVGRTDSFFDLGGHSLAAVLLLDRVERHFGRRLPLASLFARPTLAAMAEALRDEEGEPSAGSLVALQPDGERTPLFCVHAAGGSVLPYRELAARLAPARPLLAFQAPGLDGGAPLASVEALAAHHVEVLRASRPQGPYLLAGWSLGGVVAVEMGRRLRAEGAEVTAVLLFDTVTPGAGALPEAPDEAILMELFARELGLPAAPFGRSRETLGQLPPERRLEWLCERARTAGRIPPTAGPEDVERLFGVFRSVVLAVRDHPLHPYSGRLVLFRASEGPRRPPALGWEELGTGGLDVEVVPGDHFTILREPDVARLAESLEAWLARVSPWPA
jgi:amino acid adenylation domain-containing protein